MNRVFVRQWLSEGFTRLGVPEPGLAFAPKCTATGQNRLAVRAECARRSPPGVVRTRRRTGTSLRKADRLMRMESCNDTASWARSPGRGPSRAFPDKAAPGRSRSGPFRRPAWPLLFGLIESSGKIGREFLGLRKQPLGEVSLGLVCRCSSINAALERAWRAALFDWTRAKKTAKAVTPPGPAAAIPTMPPATCCACTSARPAPPGSRGGPGSARRRGTAASRRPASPADA